MKKSLRVILLVLALVLIDQSIKIYIYNNLMNKEFYIFGSIFGFKPIINIKYSYLSHPLLIFFVSQRKTLYHKVMTYLILQLLLFNKLKISNSNSHDKYQIENN